MSERRERSFKKPILTSFSRPAGFPSEMDPADFIGHMAQHFRVYFREGSPEEAQWSDSLIAVLAAYDGRCLSSTCLHFLRTRTETRFPLPAEIIDVCEEVMVDRNRAPLLEKQAEATAASPQSNERTRLTLDLLRANGFGLAAAKENWLGPLVSFVRTNARLPRQDEIAGIKRSAQLFDETREMCHAGVGWPSVPGQIHPYATAMARWADNIEARAQLWAAVLRGEEDERELLFGQPMKRSA